MFGGGFGTALASGCTAASVAAASSSEDYTGDGASVLGLSGDFRRFAFLVFRGAAFGRRGPFRCLFPAGAASGTSAASDPPVQWSRAAGRIPATVISATRRLPRLLDEGRSTSVGRFGNRAMAVFTERPRRILVRRGTQHDLIIAPVSADRENGGQSSPSGPACIVRNHTAAASVSRPW